MSTATTTAGALVRIRQPAVRAAHDLLDAGEPVAVHRNVLRLGVPANRARVLALS